MTETLTQEQVQTATIFVIDDTPRNTQEIKDRFKRIDKTINIQGVDTDKFEDFSSLIENLFYQNYIGILIDIDLRNFHFPSFEEIKNGIDIVKQLLNAKISTPIAIYSQALEDYEEELKTISRKIYSFKKGNDGKQFIKDLRGFYDLIKESEDLFEDSISYQNFLASSPHIQRSFIYNKLNSFNPDAYFEIVGDYTWCIKTSKLEKNYHGKQLPSNKPSQLKQQKKYSEIVIKENLTVEDLEKLANTSDDTLPFIYWNFRTLELLKAQIMFAFQNNTSIYHEAIWLKIFNIQAGRKLAKFYFDDKKNLETVLKLLPRLNAEGIFEFQKEYIRLSRIIKTNAQNPIAEQLDDFIKYNNLKKSATITDFFLGEVQELEKETDTAWVILRHINEPSISYKEPMSYSYLKQRGIYGEGAKFEYVFYQDERFNETVEITKI